jgi:hypothetical protein
MSWLKRFKKTSQTEEPPIEASPSEIPDSHNAKAQAYVEKVHGKIDQLVSDLANGIVNRTQFKELYSHYQREIRNIESIMESTPEDWQQASTDGQSIMIRREHMAKAQAYAIYENESGLPLGTLGEFKLDPDLVVPMLSSYRSATAEIFGAGIRATQIEGGLWLVFVPGQFSTMLAVFSNEPVAIQMEYLDKLHKHFEGANQPILVNKPIDIDDLIYPHEFYLGKWKK